MFNLATEASKLLLGVQDDGLDEEHEETRDFIFTLDAKLVASRKHCSKRLYNKEGIRTDETGHYYLYEEDSPHKQCTKCEAEFTEEEKVYLTNYFHDYDIISPFPYCKSCMQDLLVADSL